MQTSTDNPNLPNVNVFTVNLSKIGFKKADYYSHVIDIDPGQEYMIGFDQSTSSTGIAFASKDFSFVLIATIICEGKSVYDKERYMSSMLEFVRNLLMGKSLVYVAVEDVPPAYGRSYHTYKVLTELKGMLEYNLNQIPAVQAVPKAMRFSPLPQQWKSTVYDKKAGAGRFNKKAEIARDIVKIQPHLQQYHDCLSKMKGHDYDGFDAFGIVVHVRIKHFNANWDIVNKNSKVQFGAFIVLFKYLYANDMFDEFLSYFQQWVYKSDGCGSSSNLVDAKIWEDNESIYANFVMAANSNKIVCMECTNVKMLLAYLVETGHTYDKDKKLYIAACKPRNELIRENLIPKFKKAGFYCKKYYKE